MNQTSTLPFTPPEQDLILSTRIPEDTYRGYLDFHPDNKSLLVGREIDEARGVQLEFVDVVTGEWRQAQKIMTDKPYSFNPIESTILLDSSGELVLYNAGFGTYFMNLTTAEVHQVGKFTPHALTNNLPDLRPVFDSTRSKYLYYDYSCAYVYALPEVPLFKHELPEFGEHILRIGTLSASGKLAAFNFYSEDFKTIDPAAGGSNVIEIWDVEKNELLTTKNAEHNIIIELKFDPTETKLVFTAAKQKFPLMMDSISGEITSPFEQGNSNLQQEKSFPFSFSPDGKYLAVGYSLYDAQTLELLKTSAPGPDDRKEIVQVLFSRDSSMFVQGSTLGLIQVRKV